MSNLFELGSTYVSRRVNERVWHGHGGYCDINFFHFIQNCLERYKNGDWGDLDEEDKKCNDDAVKFGEDRIFAAYIYPATGEKIWIVTESDRSATIIMSPEEYWYAVV